MGVYIKGMEMPKSCILCRLECLYRIHSSTSRAECCPLVEVDDRKTEPTGYNLSPVEDEQQAETKTETKNSNLTFEKRTMRDCYNCKRYETEGECIECHYEPKDEPQDECAKEYEELGLKKLKELQTEREGE